MGRDGRRPPDGSIWSTYLISNVCSTRLRGIRAWERDDPDLSRPIAAPLDRCAELLGTDLGAVREAATNVEPYVRGRHQGR